MSQPPLPPPAAYEHGASSVDPYQPPPYEGASEAANCGDAEGDDGQMQDLDVPLTDNDEEDGRQRIPLSKNRPTKTDRVSRQRYTLQLKPLAKLRIRDIPRHAIASIIGRAAPNAELAEMASVTFDDAANSARIAVYDTVHAMRLAQVDHLILRQNDKLERIEIVIEQAPFNKNTIRGVIQVDPADSNEAILSWVQCEQADILKVRKIGKTDRAILTFDSTTLPKTVKYYMELVRVAEYRPKRLVCFNCHSLRHMAKFCPSPSVCKDCGRPHPETAEWDSAEYCVICKETGHLSVSKVCPTRLPKKEERGNRSVSSKKPPPENTLIDGDRSTPPGVTWASTVSGNPSRSPPPISLLPSNHPLVVESAQLRRSLAETRAAMTTLQKEVAALLATAASSQSPSSGPSSSVPARRSRSRTSRRKPSTNAIQALATSFIAEQMLTQRDAHLKFEANKEWQKASRKIVSLQDQVTSIRDELRQFMEKVGKHLKLSRPQRSLPVKRNEKKKKTLAVQYCPPLYRLTKAYYSGIAVVFHEPVCSSSPK